MNNTEQAVRRHIWCLWEPEGTLPPYLRMCFRTIERNAEVPVSLLSTRDLEKLAPDMDPGIAARALSPGQRSDYYRSHLLYSQGGMWLDVDSIVIGSLLFAFDCADTTGLAARRNVRGRVSTSPLLAAAGSNTMKAWIRRQESILESLTPGEVLPWTALGGPCLTESVGEAPFFEFSNASVAPLSWLEAAKFTSRYHRPSVAIGDGTRIVTLYNERFPGWLRRASESEIRQSPIMLARLLRVALGESTEREERRPLDRPGAVLERAYRGMFTSIRRR